MGDVAQQENFRFRLDPAAKQAFLRLCKSKNITQSAAVKGLVQFVLEQEDEVQSMVLRQIRPRDDLVDLMFKRMKHKKRGKA